MSAQEAQGFVGFTSHVMQSLGYYLRTGTVPTYNDATGAIEEKRLNQVVSGIIIRPAKTVYDGIPTLDLRDDETMKPYCTWFHVMPLPQRQQAYGGAHRDGALWQIEVKLSQSDLFQYQKIQDWIDGFLQKYWTIDIYFFHYDPSKASLNPPQPTIWRGDKISEARIGSPRIINRSDVGQARGEDGLIIANFETDTWRPEVQPV